MSKIWLLVAIKLAAWAALLSLIALWAGWHVCAIDYVLFLVLIFVLNVNLQLK